ncbi:IclR family transcriptional regulator [Pantoea eucrina]|nr:IclR family transcriptional regulator [Pantoea eucrina]
MATPVPAKRGKKPRVTSPAATPPAGGQVQSLTRGLRLLELIADAHGSVALTELAQQAGLPNSTTHRLLSTMQQQGFVHQVGDLATGRLAPTPLWWAAVFCRAAICWPLCIRCYGD